MPTNSPVRRGARISGSGAKRPAPAGSLIRERLARVLPCGVAPAARNGLWLGLGLVGLVAVVYAPVRNFPFVNFDDALYVVDNAAVGGGLSWDASKWAFTTGHAGNW